MQLVLKDNLPFTTLTVAYKGRIVEVANVLVDTSSAGTVLSADVVAAIEIIPEASDTLHTIRGVGGSEVVFTRKVDSLQVGDRYIIDIEIEVSGMDYGFEINGILGMDFLTRAGAIINLQEMQIEFVSRSPLL